MYERHFTSPRREISERQRLTLLNRGVNVQFQDIEGENSPIGVSAIAHGCNHSTEAWLAAVRGMGGSAPSLPVRVLKSGAG
jgi:hypothetical protein